MRIGVFGGVFDPPHLGHLLVADDVRQRLALGRVLFVPAFHPPHKAGPAAEYEDRLAMTRLAVADWPGFEVCTIEQRRDGPSYTVDTIAALRRILPRDSFYLIMGADQYGAMKRWHQLGVIIKEGDCLIISDLNALKKGADLSLLPLTHRSTE